ADTVVPRLEAAGADRRRVHIVSAVRDDAGHRAFNLAADLALLKQKICEVGDVVMVAIDPSAATSVRASTATTTPPCAARSNRSPKWPTACPFPWWASPTSPRAPALRQCTGSSGALLSLLPRVQRTS